jgi:hypothetical protein
MEALLQLCLTHQQNLLPKEQKRCSHPWLQLPTSSQPLFKPFQMRCLWETTHLLSGVHQIWVRVKMIASRTLTRQGRLWTITSRILKRGKGRKKHKRRTGLERSSFSTFTRLSKTPQMYRQLVKLPRIKAQRAPLLSKIQLRSGNALWLSIKLLGPLRANFPLSRSQWSRVPTTLLPIISRRNTRVVSQTSSPKKKSLLRLSQKSSIKFKCTKLASTRALTWRPTNEEILKKAAGSSSNWTNLNNLKTLSSSHSLNSYWA